MQILAAGILDVERNDANPAPGIRVPKYLDVLTISPAPECAIGKLEFTFVNDIMPNTVLDLEDKAGFQRLQHARCPGFFPLFNTRNEILVRHTDVVDRPSGAHTRRQITVVNP